MTTLNDLQDKQLAELGFTGTLPDKLNKWLREGGYAGGPANMQYRGSLTVSDDFDAVLTDGYWRCDAANPTAPDVNEGTLVVTRTGLLDTDFIQEYYANTTPAAHVDHYRRVYRSGVFSAWAAVGGGALGEFDRLETGVLSSGYTYIDLPLGRSRITVNGQGFNGFRLGMGFGHSGGILGSGNLGHVVEHTLSSNGKADSHVFGAATTIWLQNNHDDMYGEIDFYRDPVNLDEFILWESRLWVSDRGGNYGFLYNGTGTSNVAGSVSQAVLFFSAAPNQGNSYKLFQITA